MICRITDPEQLRDRSRKKITQSRQSIDTVMREIAKGETTWLYYCVRIPAKRRIWKNYNLIAQSKNGTTE
jgi:hypothetical protein